MAQPFSCRLLKSLKKCDNKIKGQQNKRGFYKGVFVLKRFCFPYFYLFFRQLGKSCAKYTNEQDKFVDFAYCIFFINIVK